MFIDAKDIDRIVDIFFLSIILLAILGPIGAIIDLAVFFYAIYEIIVRINNFKNFFGTKHLLNGLSARAEHAEACHLMEKGMGAINLAPFWLWLSLLPLSSFCPFRFSLLFSLLLLWLFLL